MAPSSATPTNCSANYLQGLTALVAHSDHDSAFLHIYYVMLFICSIWVVGKLFQRIGMPDLVGQIIIGIIMGPNVLNLVGDNGSDFLIVIGEIGLIMLVVEAGLDVDIGMLKLIGPRGLLIAIFGSIIPLLFGFIISILLKNNIQSSIAIGACFAPTSMGIALNVLKKAKILNTPTGQLIIASAILDDVIALMLLSELEAMANPTVLNILLPLIVSPLLIIIFGYLAIKVVPKLIKYIMNKIPEEHHENSILLLLFVATFILIPGCHYAGSSHLLGSFLAGLMFCTDHTIHHAWTNQIKRVLSWMLKIFFACAIGFAIPVKEFANVDVIAKGLLYFISIIGKLLTGIFAKPRRKKEFLTVAFSMSAWGEFAFILATASFEQGTIDKESFSSVLLAVMLSVIFSPYLLRTTLNYFNKKKMKKLDQHLKRFGNDIGHPVYYAIITKARGSWGHQDKLLHTIFEHKLEIIDFRAWHAPEYNHSHHKPLTKESFYVQDQELILPPTKYLSKEDKKRLHDRVQEIRESMKQVLGDESSVVVKRWFPGLMKSDDTRDSKINLTHARGASYCRRQAFRQAHSIMSMGNLKEVLKVELEQEKKVRFKINKNKHKEVAIDDEKEDKALKHDNHNVITELKKNNKVIKHSTNKIIKKINHSGAGHGGQARGVGSLPYTSKIIDIHDHFDEHDTDDSISCIYADEDAEHHHLPEYTDQIEYSKANSEGNSKKEFVVMSSIDYDDDQEVTNKVNTKINKNGTLSGIATHLDMNRQISDYEGETNASNNNKSLIPKSKTVKENDNQIDKTKNIENNDTHIDIKNGGDNTPVNHMNNEDITLKEQTNFQD